MTQVFGVTFPELVDGTEPSPSSGPVAQMLYRRSSVNLDAAAKSGLGLFVTFLDFYAELCRVSGHASRGLMDSPFLPGEGYGEYDVDARRKASEVRSYLGLGQGPIADVDTVCAALGITLYRAHLGENLQSTISGAFYKHPTLGMTIVVNLDMTRGRRRFTAAHELAHALLHSGSDAIIVSDSGRNGDQRERFADAFAGEFLMPEEGIRRALETLGYGPKVHDVEPVIHLQRMFNVSYITALVRLRQARIISNDVVEQLRRRSPMQTAEHMGYSTEVSEFPLMPDHSVTARYPLRFRSILKTCIADDIIGMSEAQHALALSFEEVEELIGEDTDAGGIYDQEWDEFAALGALA